MKTIAHLALAVGLMAKFEPCFGAAWEGTDDFSGTLAKWDTSYLHIDNPSDGFFLSGGQLQFIKTATTTDHSGSGAVIWPQSLPFNTNWTLMVDAHMNPGTYEAPQIEDQDVRLDVHLFSTNPAPGLPSFRIGVNTSPYAGTYGNFITIEGSDPTNIIGTDITLGMSYDSATKQVTSFYFPAGDPSSLVTIQTNNVAAWLDMRPVLYGASDYWAVSANKVWMDNFRVYGTANSRPSVAITKTAAQSGLTNGLVAHYPLNGNASDASGNGHNGFAQNTFATTNQFGEPNSALGFAGNSWVYVPYSASLFTTNYSVSMMFKSQMPFAAGGSASFCLIRSGNASTDSAHGYEIAAVDGGQNFGFWDFAGDFEGGGKCVIPVGNWQQHRWYNITFTRTGLIAKLYRDGILIASATNATPYIPAQSSPLYIGANTVDPETSDPTPTPDGNLFTGIISDVRLYNRGLSSIEVQQLYNEQSQPSAPSLKTVELSFSNLILGGNYQLQVSGNLMNWANQGSAFTATSTSMIYPQHWDTDSGGNLFFRLQVAP